MRDGKKPRENEKMMELLIDSVVSIGLSYAEVLGNLEWEFMWLG